MRWALFLLAAVLGAQSTPATEAESLTGRKLVFPNALAGQASIAIFSFSREAGDQVAAWMEPMLRQNLNVYSVAMLEAAPRLLRGIIRSGMRGSMPKNFHDRALVLTRDEKAWRALLKVAEDKTPIVVKFDPQGRIVHQFAGPYSASRLDAFR